MAIVSDIQFQDAAVKPAALDTSCSFLAASFTASTSMAVGGEAVSPTGLFTAKSTNNVEAYFETTNTNGTASIFLNNDARPMWELAVSGNTSDSFIISNCTGAGGTTHYNALSITPAGAIGLGKKSAASVLDIAYADSSTGGIILTETTNSITTKIVNEGSSGSVGTTSSHKLGFRTAGVTRGVFDTNGRLGIGTDAPGALLDVRGTAVFNEDGDDVDFRIEGDTDANLFMVDASADKIGIGTATPSTLLNIVKDQNSDTTLLIENNTAGTGAYAGHRVESDAAGGGLKVFSSSFTTSNYNIADAVVLEAFTASSGGLQLATEGAHEIGIWTTSTRRATVTSGGCIGVGIQAPDGLLHVHAGTAGSVAAGSGACNLVVENNAAGGISILTPDANAGSLVFGSASDALGAEIKHTQSTTTMEVGTKESGGILKLNSADGTNAIYIDASQNVGIGTATPGVPLRVQGNACFTGTITAACVSGGGASLWSSGSNIVYLTGSCVGIGTNDPGTNNLLTAHIDQNAASTIKVLNETAGAAAASVFTANTDTSSGFLGAYSSSFTTANQKIADGVLLQADSTASAGLHLATATTAELGFWTNNTRRMTITTGGCVGIGTATTSDEELKVQGDACVTGTMYAQTFSGGGVSDDVWTMAGQDAYYKELSAGDNVGIGTTTPAHTLHVGGNAASAPALLVCDSGGSRIEVNSGAVKINNAYTMPAADGTAGQVICTDGSDTLTFGPGGYWTCVSGPELYYTGGNVGIGTDDPVVAFHVNNGASITNLPANTRAVFANTSDADAITRVGIYAGVASAFAVLDLGRNDADCRASITYDSSVDTLAFGTAGGAADVTINASGSVGIGTATPSHLLDVEGVANFATCIVTPTVCATSALTVAAGTVAGAPSGNSDIAPKCYVDNQAAAAGSMPTAVCCQCASGSWTVPTDVDWVWVTLMSGAGGGGGGSTCNGGSAGGGGGGGGGGGIVLNNFQVFLRNCTSVSFCAPAGGAGGASNSYGTQGNTACFMHMCLKGGCGGQGTASSQSSGAGGDSGVAENMPAYDSVCGSFQGRGIGGSAGSAPTKEGGFSLTPVIPGGGGGGGGGGRCCNNSSYAGAAGGDVYCSAGTFRVSGSVATGGSGASNGSFGAGGGGGGGGSSWWGGIGGNGANGPGSGSGSAGSAGGNYGGGGGGASGGATNGNGATGGTGGPGIMVILYSAP